MYEIFLPWIYILIGLIILGCVIKLVSSNLVNYIVNILIKRYKDKMKTLFEEAISKFILKITDSIDLEQEIFNAIEPVLVEGISISSFLTRFGLQLEILIINKFKDETEKQVLIDWLEALANKIADPTA